MSTLMNFDMAFIQAYGADKYMQEYYWRNLLKIFRGLDRKDLRYANSLMNILISRLTIEEQVKFFKLAEQA